MAADTEHALDLWAPRRQLTLAQARSRTQIIQYVRIGLVILATITMGVFLGYVSGSLFESLQGGRDQARSASSVEMINVRYRGRDANGFPYLIVADTAQQRREDENLIDMTNVKLTDADGSEITAPRGLWDRDAAVLELYDDVVVRDSAGYVFYSTHARIFISENRVVGVEPLQGTGPIGDIRSDTYELFNSGEHVRLTGRVRTTLYEDGSVSTSVEEN